jgi:hypothetical protein
MYKWVFIFLSIYTLPCIGQGIINNGANLVVNENSCLFIKGQGGNYDSRNYDNRSPVLANHGLFLLQGNWNNNTNAPLDLIAAYGIIEFKGTYMQSINGIYGTCFNSISINNPADVFLYTNISIRDSIKMIAGNLDIGNKIINLGTTGRIANETENSRIVSSFGTNGGCGFGYVTCVKDLKVGINSNIAGLGIDISSRQDLGTTTIERFHFSSNYGGMKSISKGFNIYNLTATSKRTTLRFYYFENELNGNDEDALVFWNSENNGADWSLQSPSVRNSEQNYIETTGISLLSMWTIGPSFASITLPIELISFEGTCINDQMKLKWTTASETNNAFFTVERSSDAKNFKHIGWLNAAGNSNTYQNYELIDSFPSSAAHYYRLKQTDFNGNSAYSPVKSFQCVNSSGNEIMVNCYPNPFHKEIKFTTCNLNTSSLQIKIIDALGSIMIQKEYTNIKENQFEFKLDLSVYKAGIYYYIISTDNSIKSGQIIRSDAF